MSFVFSTHGMDSYHIMRCLLNLTTKCIGLELMRPSVMITDKRLGKEGGGESISLRYCMSEVRVS